MKIAKALADNLSPFTYLFTAKDKEPTGNKPSIAVPSLASSTE
ncbi:MAG TPA: hypothetical protein ACQGQH_09810 [Xylella sp.]